MSQTLAVTANNLLCELTYRLYKNAVNEKYLVRCESYDLNEISSMYYIYNSGCDLTEEAKCIDVILPVRNFCTDLNVDISTDCLLVLRASQAITCEGPELSIRKS